MKDETPLFNVEELHHAESSDIFPFLFLYGHLMKVNIKLCAY